MENNFEVGQIVKFAVPMTDFETEQTFLVLELRGPRLLLQELHPSFDSWTIKPTCVYDASDMIAAE